MEGKERSREIKKNSQSASRTFGAVAANFQLSPRKLFDLNHVRVRKFTAHDEEERASYQTNPVSSFFPPFLPSLLI